MRLGKWNLARGAALAPMAGVGDRAFRETCVEQGAVYVVGEMVSAKGLRHGNSNTWQLLELGEAERPAAIQLFGDEPDALARAAADALARRPDAIDLNMGCPAPKIAGNGSGCALMKDPALAGRIIRAVSRAVEIPVTVKFRKGWDEDSVNAVEFAKIAEQNGAAALCVHGRTRAQMYAPPVDLGVIAAVKQAVSIPVIGNGGVDSPEKAKEMLDTTGCDLVMTGQGALGAPWVFRRIAAFLRDGVLLPEPSREEKMAVMLRHIALACRYKGESAAMREARKHVGWYLRGWRGAAALRVKAGGLCAFRELEALAELALETRQAQGEME